MRSLVLATFVVLGAEALGQQAVTPPEFRSAVRYERNVIVRNSGANRLPVDVPLLTGASPFSLVREEPRGRAGTRTIARGGLRDLRLFDADGREIPHLVVDPAAPETSWIRANPIPIVASRKASGFEVDLGRLRLIDLLEMDGLPAPFLKRVGLQGSGDRVRWTVLSHEATVFDLPDQQLTHRAVGFPPGEYRYLRLVWDDTNSARMPLPGRTSLRSVDPASTTPAPLRIRLDVERRISEPRRSRFRLRLPAARLPIVALDIDAGGADLHRQATVLQTRVSGQEAEPHVLGRALLRRTTTHGLSASWLRIPITAPTQAVLELVVDDGDNPSLDLRSVTAECAELPWIYFEAESGARVVARYGRTDAEPPRYDLEARRSAIADAVVAPALWGPVRETVSDAAAAAPAPNAPPSGAVVDPSGFRYTRSIPTGQPVLVALQVDAALLAHSAGPAGRFRDIRILDEANRQIPYLVERRDEPLMVSLPRPELLADPEPDAQRPDRSPAPTAHRLRLPFSGLPPSTLVLITPARLFQREIRAAVDIQPADKRSPQHRRVVATATWTHGDTTTVAPVLTMSVPSLKQSTLTLLVDDGDNSKLPIAAADLLLPGYRLRFYRPAGTTLRLVYGQPSLGEPRYDLALLSVAVLNEAAEEVMADPERDQRGSEQPSPLAMRPIIYYGLLAVAVVVIVGIIVRLLRQDQRPGSEGGAP